jgi:3-phenylpropionate/cinnamic acid dioxygenase small subunit
MDTLDIIVRKQEVVDLVTELFVATDQRDWAAVRRCFAAQVHFDMSRAGAGPATRRTPDEIADGWAEGLKGIEALHHQAGNFRVTVYEDRATASCYGIAYHFRRTRSGHNTRTFVGSYSFVLQRGGHHGWLITSFRFDLKFIDGNPQLELDG